MPNFSLAILIASFNANFDGTKKELERIFGDNRIVEIYSTNLRQINFKRYGRIMQKKTKMALYIKKQAQYTS